MLSIAKIAASGSGYLARDNYYVKGEDDAGQWFGKGAKRLGLEGGVDNEQFDKMLKGKFNEVELGRINKDGERDHHPGWDHTFSAPKSVSLLALFGGDTRLIKAHDEATNYALEYIEKNLAETRVRIGGQNGFIDNQKTGNIVCAKYRHDISRLKDPQLHTHTAILNATFGANGTLRSLDSPILYEHKMLVGAIYQNKLSALVRDLGYEIEIRDDGTFSIKGVDNELIDQSSKRRNEIQVDIKDKGIFGAIAAQYSALATRPQKEALSHFEKIELWNEDFKEHFTEVKALIEKSQQLENTSKVNIDHHLASHQYKTATLAVNSAIKHLSETESVFKDIDIQREAIVANLSNAPEWVVEDVINEKINNGELLKSKITEIKMSNEKIRKVDKLAYTTPELLSKEKQTLKIMTEERFKVEPIINNKTELIRENIFTQGQKNAAKAILTSEDRFINIQGSAGTGKTFMLEEVKEQAEKQNYKIRGFAPSGAAANVLQKETGIETQTLQKFLKQGLRDLNKPKNQDTNLENTEEPKQKEIWVVDEASFISTTQANALVKIATRENTQVVLIGDSKQLSGVEAGKPFAISQAPKHRIRTVVMDEIVRQKNTELKQAVYSATKGDIKTAFANIDKDIIEVKDKFGNDDPILRRNLIANTYASMSKKEQDNTLIISPANEERTVINDNIRKDFIEDGILKDNKITTTNLVNKNLTNEAKTKTYNYSTNNLVRFNRSYKRLNITENSYLRIKEVNHDTGIITLAGKDKNGKDIEWNPEKLGSKGAEVYFESKREIRQGERLFWRRAGGDKTSSRRTNEKIEVLKVDNKNNSIEYADANGEVKSMKLGNFNNKHWEYAYCLTAHQAQGQTADNVIINLESWRSQLSNQQAFYVEISRAKYKIIIFTDDKDQLQRQLITNTGEKQSALEQVLDSRVLDIDKQLEVLNEQDNNKQYKLEDVILSPELEQKAVLLLSIKEADQAVDIILGNKEQDGDWVLFEDKPGKYWQEDIDKTHQKLEVLTGKQNYQELLEGFRQQGKIHETSQTINLEQSTQKAIIATDIITGELKTIGTDVEKQQQINQAHSELKEIVGNDNYQALIADLSQKNETRVQEMQQTQNKQVTEISR